MKKSKNFTVHIPRWEELPDIDLYLDQVITFIDKSLSGFIDYNSQEDNKILTKTMVNNYVKQKIIDAPIKKKYNRTNVACLIIICILKQVYSINDISKLIKIGLVNTPEKIAYNTFCESLENTIDFTFNKNRNLDYSEHSRVEYLLFNVVQTFASKLYVQKTYLKNVKKNKSEK